MDTETQRKLDGYIALFDAISEKTDSDAVAITILQEMSKDRRSRQMSGERAEKTNGEPATARQKGFMKRLGIEFPENITKAEASALIDEEQARNGE
jgi:hypothetical protein